MNIYYKCNSDIKELILKINYKDNYNILIKNLKNDIHIYKSFSYFNSFYSYWKNTHLYYPGWEQIEDLDYCVNNNIYNNNICSFCYSKKNKIFKYPIYINKSNKFKNIKDCITNYKNNIIWINIKFCYSCYFGYNKKKIYNIWI